MKESRLIAGVAFKKTFSYAGFEMQRKKFENPKIVLLNVELELKKENAELRIENVEVSDRREALPCVKRQELCCIRSTRRWWMRSGQSSIASLKRLSAVVLKLSYLSSILEMWLLNYFADR